MRLPIIILFPYIDCRTKEIYKKVKNFSLSSKALFEKDKSKYILKYLQADKNDTKNSRKKYLKISILIKNIGKQKGCIFSRMTGSGSACYGYLNQKTAKIAMNI